MLFINRYAGQVGYIIANMKNIKDALVGETIYHQNKPTEPMPGFKPAKPMVKYCNLTFPPGRQIPFVCLIACN
jgi:translation elongation factor EF-4